MKTLKNLFCSALFILLSALVSAQEPATITLTSSKNINDAKELIVDLEGDIITDTWDKDYIRIEMEIKADEVSKEVVKYLVRKNRFRIKTQYLNSESIMFYTPNLNLPVYINGRKLSENISYKISVPKNVSVFDKSSMDL